MVGHGGNRRVFDAAAVGMLTPDPTSREHPAVGMPLYPADPRAVGPYTVLRRLGQARRVVHAIVVKEDAMDLVSFRQRGLAEQVRRITRLVLVRPFIDQYPEFHARTC